MIWLILIYKIQNYNWNLNIFEFLKILLDWKKSLNWFYFSISYVIIILEMIIKFKYWFTYNFSNLETSDRMISLLMAPLNVNFRILRVKTLKNSDITESHLANLGFVKGAVIKVVNENDGNLIVSIKDARVAIGKDIAKKIMVEEM